MKTLKNAEVESKDFAMCNEKILVSAGKSCNERDLACGKSTR